MEPKDIHSIIAEMKYKNQITVRQKESLSWGSSPEVCRDLFMRIFCELDTTYDNPRYLPEYDEIVDWMVNTNDKGLLLMGDCGRGKSIIITGVVPVLLRLKGRNVKPAMTVISPTLPKGTPTSTTRHRSLPGISSSTRSVPKPCTTTTESVSSRSISS